MLYWKSVVVKVINLKYYWSKLPEIKFKRSAIEPFMHPEHGRGVRATAFIPMGTVISLESVMIDEQMKTDHLSPSSKDFVEHIAHRSVGAAKAHSLPDIFEVM